jgi:hypothetical protein
MILARLWTNVPAARARLHLMAADLLLLDTADEVIE